MKDEFEKKALRQINKVVLSVFLLGCIISLLALFEGFATFIGCISIIGGICLFLRIWATSKIGENLNNWFDNWVDS